MIYNLNSYHRNITKKELLEDLLTVSNQLNKRYVSQREYISLGQFSAMPYISNFGTWKNALKCAGLDVEREAIDYQRITNKELIDDIKHVASILKQNTVSTTEYKIYGKYSIHTMLLRFGNWNNALKESRLIETGYHKIEDEELFEEIERLWIEKGSQPTTSDIKNGKSKFALNTYSRHFGGWRAALESFIKWVDDDKPDKQKVIMCDEVIPNNTLGKGKKSKQIKNVNHRTSRDINLRLRFIVLRRDNFKCCLCGASPAKDPTVELHIDHIKPWSKGGETVIDNLQTLCSKCNLGKSDE